MKVKRLSRSTPLSPLFEKLDVSAAGSTIMQKKAEIFYLQIENIKTPAANILKQDALSIGADFAVPAGVICCESEYVDGLLIANRSQLETLIQKEKAQPFGLAQLQSLILPHLQASVSDSPKIMGVINANEDSFFQGSRFQDAAAVERIGEMIDAGAGIIDLGAVSTRPGSEPVSEEEELERIAPILQAIHSRKLYERAIFSIDSYTPGVIQKALDSGFSIINDITGLQNPQILELAAEYDASAVIMHMQGTPQTMQNDPSYDDVLHEIEHFFQARITQAKEYGVNKLILDPGIGFGKTAHHNLLLLKHLSHYHHHGYPLLIGASRKSLIHAFHPSMPEERLPGTLALHLKAIEEGAAIIRCHDVKEHAQAFAIHAALSKTHL